MNVPHLTAGENPPHDLYVFIENPKGTSNTKYEWNPALQCLTLARLTQEPMIWPYNYGFINRTLAGDGDALDAFVIMDEPLVPQTVVRVRPIGALLTEDQAGIDLKLICTPFHPDMPKEMRGKLGRRSNFALAISRLEAYYKGSKALSHGKWVNVKSVLTAAQAKTYVTEAVAAYNATP